LPVSETYGALQRPHVLIVSDDPDLTAFLSEGLVYAGFWTSTIASALQTLEVFRLRSFDIMVLDAALGGMGAVELLRRLRGRSERGGTARRTDIPILLVAGAESELSPALGEEAGADEHLVAPIELVELAEVLRRHVATWRAAHPGRRWADEEALSAP
jgi:DNA-binding response OmpR family regulator